MRLLVFFLALGVAVVAAQLFLPPAIGLANNGDFGKVAGRLCIGDAEDGAQNFIHFRADYIRGPRFCWDAGVRSSEYVPAWIASMLQRAAGPPGQFDIRWLGAVHGAVFTAAYVLLLLALRPLPPLRFAVLAAAALWIFGDVSLVSYFNSFYTDTAAALGLLLTAVVACHLAVREQAAAWWWVLFGAAALLFVTSKAQHGIFGVLPAGFAIAAAVHGANRSARAGSLAAGIAILLGSAYSIARTPEWYKGQARFNLIFTKLAGKSPDPARDLVELGLTPEHRRYSGMHAFIPGGPAHDAKWMDEFCRSTSYGAVARFYARHPGRALALLRDDLRTEAWQRRAVNLSNYRKGDGYPPGAKTSRFASWSALRTALFRWSPEHVVLWFAAVLAAAAWVAARGRDAVRRLALVCLAIAAAGVGEFATASLVDAMETHRHLFLFHLMTDLTFYLALAFAVIAMRRRARQLTR